MFNDDQGMIFIVEEFTDWHKPTYKKLHVEFSVRDWQDYPTVTTAAEIQTNFPHFIKFL